MNLPITIIFVLGCLIAFFYPCKERWSTICLKLFGIFGLLWIFFSAHMNGHHHAYYIYFAGVSGGAAVGILICLLLARQLGHKLGHKRNPSSSTKS